MSQFEKNLAIGYNRIMENKNAKPLDYLFYCLKNDIKPGEFDINNAADELKRLKQQLKDLQKNV
jgi:hypothetical protein